MSLFLDKVIFMRTVIKNINTHDYNLEVNCFFVMFNLKCCMTHCSSLQVVQFFMYRNCYNSLTISKFGLGFDSDHSLSYIELYCMYVIEVENIDVSNEYMELLRALLLKHV